MLDRHAVHALLKAGTPSRKIAAQFGVSQRTIQRIAGEPPVTSADEPEAERKPGPGRPGLADTVGSRLRELIEEETDLAPLEYLRRLRLAGFALGESTFYRLFRRVRNTLPVELMVRFEGVPGEFAQFDFGEVDVRLLPDGKRRRRIHFAAYRLKYSRWIWVEVVPNQRIEPLIRSLLHGFEHSGGVPLSVVFDRPKTVVTGYEPTTKRPIWHEALGQTVLDYGFAIELCAPYTPKQKGAVENLVGFAKRRYFRARYFADEDDVARQLPEWLEEINDERPNRATKEIPAARLGEEQARMKRLAVRPDDYGLRFAVQVGPTAIVEFNRIRYAMPVKARGIPATLYLYPKAVRIVTAGGRFDVTHARFPDVGTTCYIAGQRSEQLALVAGARKRLYFMRERILELGTVGEAYLTELIHARPRTWKGDVERLFALLEEVGDDAFLQLLQRAMLKELYGAEFVVRLAARQEKAS